MSFDEIAMLIPGNKKKNGNGYMSKCPAHDDKTASLRVEPGVTVDGRQVTLAHCYAGYTINAITDALGMKVSDLYAEMTQEE